MFMMSGSLTDEETISLKNIFVQLVSHKFKVISFKQRRQPLDK